MMLDRPLIDTNSTHSIDLPFHVCKYHWDILTNAYQRYLISIDEATSQAEWIARACPTCETPR